MTHTSASRLNFVNIPKTIGRPKDMAKKRAVLPAPGGWKPILLQMKINGGITFKLVGNDLAHARRAIRNFYNNPKNPPMRFATKSDCIDKTFTILRKS